MSFFRSKYFTFSFVLIIIAVLILAMTWETGRSVTSLMWLNPVNTTMLVGNTTTLDLQLDNTSNVYGAEVKMVFDPTVLEVVGEAITPGTCPQPDFVVINTTDNFAGAIDYAVTQLNPTPPCEGGVIASMEFLCKHEDPGTEVTIMSSLISDPDGSSITHTTQNATIVCEAATSSLLTFAPQNSTLVVGEFITVDVVVEDVFDLYGVQMEIAFDPDYIQVVDADTSKTGIQIVPGTCPEPDFIVQNTASNTLGTIEYSVTSLNPTSPCYGKGVVASLKFQAIVEGETDIHFANRILANSDGLSISNLSQDGFIAVYNQHLIFLPVVIKLPNDP